MYSKIYTYTAFYKRSTHPSDIVEPKITVFRITISALDDVRLIAVISIHDWV